MSVPVIPSPMPPYSRTNQSPQTLTDSGDILTSKLTTYLRATTAETAVLPDGTVRQQRKNIYIPSDMLETTGVWTVTGTFAGGFMELKFRGIAHSATLEWDGEGWQMIGGNAEPQV